MKAGKLVAVARQTPKPKALRASPPAEAVGHRGSPARVLTKLKNRLTELVPESETGSIFERTLRLALAIVEESCFIVEIETANLAEVTPDALDIRQRALERRREHLKVLELVNRFRPTLSPVRSTSGISALEKAITQDAQVRVREVLRDAIRYRDRELKPRPEDSPDPEWTAEQHAARCVWFASQFLCRLFPERSEYLRAETVRDAVDAMETRRGRPSRTDKRSASKAERLNRLYRELDVASASPEAAARQHRKRRK